MATQRTLLCYICGGKFQFDGFAEHLHSCERRRLEENELLPLALRQSVHFPSRQIPGSMAPLADIREYNRVSLEMHERILPKCSKCGAIFSHSRRLLVHFPTCGKPSTPKAPTPSLFVEDDSSSDDEPLVLARGVFGADNPNYATPVTGKPALPAIRSRGHGQQPPTTATPANARLVCYLCGRQYGLASLMSHQKKCIAKPRDPVPEKPSRQLPRASDGPEAFRLYNEEARKCIEDAVPTCEYCSRKFKDMERLSVHLRGCDLAKEARAEAELANAHFLRRGVVPRMLTCFLCGGQFGSQSLFIHQSECEKRFDEAQRRLPLDERVDHPDPPNCPVPAADDPLSAYSRYNELAAAVYASSLGRCVHCDRSFPIQRLADHEAACVKGKDVGKTPVFEQFERPSSAGSWWSPAVASPVETPLLPRPQTVLESPIVIQRPKRRLWDSPVAPRDSMAVESVNESIIEPVRESVQSLAAEEVVEEIATPSRKLWGKVEVPSSFLETLEEKKMDEEWNFCVDCGAEFVDKARFCHGCGAKRDVNV